MITDLLQPDDLSRLRNLQVLVRHRVEGFCSGLHRSPNKGQSVDFREHRPYSKGDALRGIDWKVFGKSDRLYIRQYEEETNLRCHLVVDSSGSMAYSGSRSGGQSKLQYASRLAAAMAYLMIHQQDSVGLVSFDKSIHRYLPPRSLVTHLGAVATCLSELKATPADVERGEPQDFALHTLVPKLRRGGLVVLFSDCFGDISKLAQSLSQFVQAKNDVLVFQVLDPDEVDFPFQNMTQFRSLEAGKLLQRIDSGRLRKSYLQRFEKFQAELGEAFGRSRVNWMTVTSDQEVADVLAQLLTSGRNRG
ncbi:DUF58 domain-containing protein [Planctomycetaceae bacterium SH139]